MIYLFKFIRFVLQMIPVLAVGYLLTYCDSKIYIKDLVRESTVNVEEEVRQSHPELLGRWVSVEHEEILTVKNNGKIYSRPLDGPWLHVTNLHADGLVRMSDDVIWKQLEEASIKDKEEKKLIFQLIRYIGNDFLYFTLTRANQEQVQFDCIFEEEKFSDFVSKSEGLKQISIPLVKQLKEYLDDEICGSKLNKVNYIKKSPFN